MSLPCYIALVSEIESSKLPFSELTEVAAAINKQLVRDFTPIWGINATINAFPSIESVPLGSWNIILRTEIGQDGAVGVHKHPKNAQPIALVEYGGDPWPLQASHECLEMLADPYLSRLVVGTCATAGGIRVQFLVEVCDPCQHRDYSYSVNGIELSDFVTPRYFDPVSNVAVGYSYTGAVTAPHDVLPGGYLSFLNPNDELWYQDNYMFGERKIYPIGAPDAAARVGLRAAIDGVMTGIARGRIPRLRPADLDERKPDSANERSERAKRLRKQIRDWDLASRPRGANNRRKHV